MFPFRQKKENRIHRTENPETRFFRFVVLFGIGVILLMFITAGVVFVLTLDGKEQTMVPNLTGMKLENAILELQEKALYPGIQLRFSENMADKGTVLGQEPSPGTLVKAESRVVLRVSKGASIERLENYTGWNINELESHLRSLEAIYGPLIRLQRPFVRVYDESPAGTILEQKPEPGTQLSMLTDLELVVSRGAEGELTEVRDYIEMPWDQALRVALGDDYPFTFTVRPLGRGQKPGTVIAQSPSPESEVPAETIRQIIVSAPDPIPRGYVFGIFERSLPDFPVPVPIRVEAVHPAGERKTLVTFRHRGGPLTVPYLEPEGSVLIVYLNDIEEIRQTVR